VFLTKHVTSFQIFLNLFQCMGFLKCFAFLWILFFCLLLNTPFVNYSISLYG
jgi:hypothetical protein